ncbi:MAG: hypothetical protein Alpg2KO_14910 [Alphaproteobacteria bacterium]
MIGQGRMSKRRYSKGTTIISYALLLGLIGIIALQALTFSGATITTLFDRTATAVGGANGDGGGQESPEDANLSLSFVNVLDADNGTIVESNIVRLSGLSAPAAISLAGDATASYRVCADSACNSVVENWTTSSGQVTDGQYAQLRMIAATAFGETRSATLTVRDVDGAWSVSTPTEPGVAVFASNLYGVQVHAYPYDGSGTTLTWSLMEQYCVSRNNTFVPGSSGGSSNGVCFHSNVNRLIVTPSCPWNNTNFSHVSGAIPSGQAGYMCSDISCSAGKVATGSSMSGYTGGAPTVNAGDYIFCAAPVPSGAVWMRAPSPFNALVYAYEYTGPAQTLTWQLHHDTCQAAGKVTPGSSSSNTSCSYSSSQRHVVTNLCNWSSQNFVVGGSLPSGTTGYMCSFGNCDQQHQVVGSSISVNTSGQVTINTGDYVFCSP